jgi:hypothetical protein
MESVYAAFAVDASETLFVLLVTEAKELLQDLSPISTQARVSVSSENVRVPGKPTCSFDFPIACNGRIRTGMSAGMRLALDDPAVDAPRWSDQ